LRRKPSDEAGLRRGHRRRGRFLKFGHHITLSPVQMSPRFRAPDTCRAVGRTLRKMPPVRRCGARPPSRAPSRNLMRGYGSGNSSNKPAIRVLLFCRLLPLRRRSRTAPQAPSPSEPRNPAFHRVINRLPQATSPRKGRRTIHRQDPRDHSDGAARTARPGRGAGRPTADDGRSGRRQRQRRSGRPTATALESVWARDRQLHCIGIWADVRLVWQEGVLTDQFLPARKGSASC
jgi:hypothetical protein